MTIDSDTSDAACGTDSESASGDDFLLWAAIDDSEDGKTSPLWFGVCLLVLIVVVLVIALCS